MPTSCPRGVQETSGVPKLLSNGGPECQKSFQNGGFARIRESTNSASDGSLCDVDVVRLWDLWIFQDCYFVFCFRLAASIPETVRFSQMVPQASKRASKMKGSCIYGSALILLQWGLRAVDFAPVLDPWIHHPHYTVVAFAWSRRDGKQFGT